MNKKYSTLMAGALLALSTSAFAEVLPLAKSPASKVEGKKYFLIQNVVSDVEGAAATLDAADRALGMRIDPDTKQLFYHAAEYKNSGFSTADDFDVNNYLWEVTQSTVEGDGNKYYYTFKNVATGELLRVPNGTVEPGRTLAFEDQVDDTDAYKNGLTSFILNNSTNRYLKYEGKTNATFYLKGKYEESTSVDAVLTFYDGGGVYGRSVDNQCIQLYEATDQEASGEELNNLYNAVGFNFDLKKGYEDVDNSILNGGDAIYAIKLANDVNVVDGDTKFGFPAGTYLAVETPAYDYDDSWEGEVKLNYLLNSTFVAVSPTDNASNKADNQNKGEGFQLTTVAGKELNLMKTVTTSEINGLDASDKPCGSTINVWNTVFTVNRNDINNAGYYALSLKHFYYVKTTDKTTDMQWIKNDNIRLGVKSDASYNSNEYLVSGESATPNYIFKFVESNIKDATKLLSAEGKSVYNIQIGDDLFLENHMVQAGTYNYFATGSAMADLNSPAYQFVITKVSADGVTFTNRASGNALIVKLYEQGDYYSLAYKGDKKFEILDIQNNGDVKKRTIDGTTETEFGFHRMPVQLIPAETEAISGWDVADGTQVTIAFARDNAPTSNKMYPQLNADGTGLDKNELTDDAFEAVQWQLEKSSKPKYTTYTYAYLDKDEKVAYKTKGDTIAYYTYNFRLVDDGNVTDKYLKKPTSTSATSSENAYSIGAIADAGKFIISTDWDDSEIITIDGKAFISVNKYMQNPYADIDKELTRYMANNSIQTLSYANQIKTYLVQDAPAVSLPATATYVTLQSELGNYIAMDGEKDGIVISNEPLTYRVFATDLDAAVPSFLISTGFDAEDKARNFLFNPEDSVNYYVGAGAYDKNYEWAEDTKKAIFKSGILSENNDTLTTSIKGKVTEVAMKADNKGTKGGLNRFKYQIVLADAEDDLYVIRQIAAGYNGKTQYLSSINDKLTWVYNEPKAMKFVIAGTVSPTANEAIAAEGVQVIGGQGAVTVQGAAGKVITVANVLGQTIANQVAASDNVTIAAPAGIVVVAVEGEATKVVVK